MSGPDLARRLEAAAAVMVEAAAVLRRAAPATDWLDEALDPGGDGLKTDEAAFIAGISPEHDAAARGRRREHQPADRNFACRLRLVALEVPDPGHG